MVTHQVAKATPILNDQRGVGSDRYPRWKSLMVLVLLMLPEAKLKMEATAAQPVHSLVNIFPAISQFATMANILQISAFVLLAAVFQKRNIQTT